MLVDLLKTLKNT